jgi:hypothetical protein
MYRAYMPSAMPAALIQMGKVLTIIEKYMKNALNAADTAIKRRVNFSLYYEVLWLLHSQLLCNRGASSEPLAVHSVRPELINNVVKGDFSPLRITTGVYVKSHKSMLRPGVKGQMRLCQKNNATGTLGLKLIIIRRYLSKAACPHGILNDRIQAIDF